MKLTDIPGVGARLKDRLVKHYGDEDGALKALLKGDVPGLMALRGMSERQAVSVVQKAQGMKYEVVPNDFLVTNETVEIYNNLMEQIGAFAHTDHARLRMNTFFPSSCQKLIEENRQLAQLAMEYAVALKGHDLDRLLSQVKPLKKGTTHRVRGRVLAVDSVEILNDLKEQKLDKLIDVHLVNDARELKDLVGGYDHVVILGEHLDSSAFSDVEEVANLEGWYLVPEAILNRYVDNQAILEAVLNAADIIEQSGLRSFPDLGILKKFMHQIWEGDDEESRRLSNLLEKLDACVNEALIWANSELKRKMESCSVTLAGEDLLQALSHDDELRTIFSSQMGDTFNEVLEAAKHRVESHLDLTGLDKAHLEDIILTEVRYPLEANRQAMFRFQQTLRRRLELRRLEARRNLAKELASKWDLVQEMVTDLLEFDLIYSLGKFTLEKDLRMPQFVEGSGLGFQKGRNLFLENPDPVDYSVGVTGLSEFKERVVILSGVNSGGKTTLLELVAQIVILAHMGLPVPAASCNLPLFEELYFFGKNRGTLGAGAFESTVRKFSLVANEKRKLVLADELEAITEPGASAKIIASLLDELARGESVAIFVSHLAEEVQRFVETDVRTDGIESSGLDDENNLIVDRNPKYNHLAKSTPELIIDRLVRTTSGQEKEFYSRLLGKFK